MNSKLLFADNGYSRSAVGIVLAVALFILGTINLEVLPLSIEMRGRHCQSLEIG